jgi:radical SAM protein with 4Fe4S-binding SPASM domain
VHLAYTSRCNLNCKHCFARDYNNKTENNLTFEDKVNILDQMVELGIFEILIGGGEPFIEEDFIDFLKECEKRSINTKVFTNGLLLTDEIIEELSKIKLGYISVSIDGADSITYGKMRGTESKFMDVVDATKKLVSKCDYPVVMQTTASRINMGEIEELMTLAQKTGVNRFKVRPIKPGGSVLNNPEVVLQPEEFLGFVKEAEQIWQNKFKDDFILDYSWGNARLDFDCENDVIEIEGFPQPHTGYGCLAGKMSIFINPCGSVFPCVFLVSYIGADDSENINKQSIQQIWENGPTFNMLRNLTGNDTCLSCKSYDICRGGCIARILFENKEINAVDPWCLEKFFPAKVSEISVKKKVTIE